MAMQQNELTGEGELPDMRGNRFKPLTRGVMTPAQLRMVDSVMQGKRGSMQGPYNVLLRSLELGQLAQQFGAHTRFHSSLPTHLNELAILLVARFWTCQFVWFAHRTIGAQAGLDEGLIRAIANGQAPSGMNPDVATVYGFCNELLQTRRVADATYADMVERFGEAGVVDAMGTMSYYTLVSMSLNVDGYPLPPGEVPELPFL
jgi:4-carboxymuconolactone decarboxylase